jgi:hypothetical protein
LNLLIRCKLLYKKFSRADGYAIVYALFITLIIVTMLIFLFSYLIISKKLETKNINKKKLDLACYSAVQAVISDTLGTKDYNKTIIIDSINVQLEKRINGIYYQLTATAKHNNDSTKYLCLVAAVPDTVFNNAVIITNPNLNAVIADNTVINGSILTMTNRFTKERIPGKNNGANIIEGMFKKSDKIKQKYFNEKILSEQFFLLDKGEYDSTISEDLIINESNYRSFINKKVKVERNVIIKGSLFVKRYSSITVKCRGGVVFKDSTRTDVSFNVSCDSNAVVSHNCSISNITLFTKAGITVSSGCVFENAQLFSKYNIRITESLFKYPTVICLYNNELQKKADKELQINKSKINGTVMLVSSVTGLSVDRSKIKIDYDSVIKGVIYSENQLEVGSTIQGSLYFYSLYFYKDPTEYIDWLTDLHVNRKNLENTFLLPIGFDEKKKYGIMSENWVY